MGGALAFSPVIVVFLLLLLTGASVFTAGLAGYLVTVVLALGYFSTSLEVVLRSTIAGFLASLPVSIIVVASLFQLTLMETAGAMSTIVGFSKKLCEKDELFQILIIVIGVGTLLSSAGAVPVTVITPILVALGYSPMASIALSALGYDALCTYTILGVPLVVYAEMVETDLITAARYFLPFVGIVSFAISLAVLYLAGGTNFLKRGFSLAVLVGVMAFFGALAGIWIRAPVLTGLIAGFLIIVSLSIVYRFKNRVSIVTEKLDVKRLLVASSPWLLLIFFIVFVNLVKPVHELFYQKWSMPIDVLKGKPVHLRVLWQAYTWIFVSALLAIFIYRVDRKQLRDVFTRTKKRAVQPFWSATVFFLIAYVMLHSGYEITPHGLKLVQIEKNMIHAMAVSSAKLFGSFYAFFTPFLGVLGGFVTGTQTSATAMFARYTVETSKLLDLSGLYMAAAVAFGSGLASAISPSKLQNAAASIDKIGEEKKVLPRNILIVLLMALLTAIVAYMLRRRIV
ncbi:lactate permease [Thermotoga sp. Ku-13t]|uniref:L-lactate permease n=1 Tax=Thermotoga sp. Ku-13t TaxID=1755813 RepID=UPI0013EBA04D|nr:L-lactate permease [Thermotoga sp. Ku-13t]KAF2958611.1 lactate permease [Thermotoga sp. Ku-13t]